MECEIRETLNFKLYRIDLQCIEKCILLMCNHFLISAVTIAEQKNTL